MKVRITHLKAPWPEGSAVGSVVEVAGDALPESILGKCVPADDGEEALAVFAPPPLPMPVSEPAKAPAADADALQAQAALLQAAQDEADELRARLAASDEALKAAQGLSADLQAQVATLQAELAAATAKKK